MKTGLFFGSFNPIHMGHMILANYLAEYAGLGQIWFVISPQNPLKKKDTLLNGQYRLQMVKLAIENDIRFMACDAEYNMPKPSYTYDTLTHLSNKYPNNEFIILMGSDGLESFHEWKNHEQIVQQYHRFVYPRHTNEDIDMQIHKNISVIGNAPKIELSSSFVRQAIHEKKNIRYLLPMGVFDFIMKNNLY